MRLILACLVLFSQLGHSLVSVQTIRNAYASTNVTTAAWVELSAALKQNSKHIEIFDSSGQTLELGVGPAGAESRVLIVVPGGNGHIPLDLPKGKRLAIKAISANATSGEINLNILQ